MNNKDIRLYIEKAYKNSDNEKTLSKIIKRKNNYYLKDTDNNPICKITQLEDVYTLFEKKDKKWVKITKGNLKDIFNNKNINEEKNTILFTKDQINRLNRGIYRYIESKSKYIPKKDFEAKARFGRIYLIFYIDEIFRINIYNHDYTDCALFIQKKKTWKELKTGDFDEVMKYLDSYFKNHYANDKII